MWIVRCDLDQVRSLIEKPELWMQVLSAQAGEEIILRSPFTMKIRLLPTAAGIPKPKSYVVQGIHDTGIVTIRPSGVNIFDATDPWNTYWTDWADDTKVPLVVAELDNVRYGHLELTDANDDEDVRADKVTAFLVRAATAAAVTAGGPLWLDTILKKRPQGQAFGDLSTLTTNSRAFSPVTDAEVANMNFTFSGEFGATAVACDNMAGTVVPAVPPATDPTVIVDDITVKSYSP
jgi:hypothetical protein